MARTVNKEEYAAKRDEILSVAQRLVYTKGYERMTVQDILHEIGMSSGAFYHYFETKPAVLEALVEKIQEEAEQPLLPVVHDPELSAVDKLRGYFATMERSRDMQKAFIAQLVRIWFADENSIVREKVHEAIIRRRSPLLTAIITQGIREGVFSTPHPAQTSEVILVLARGMGDTLAKLMLSIDREGDDQSTLENIAATYAVYADAVERVLGAARPFLVRPDLSTVRGWFETGDRS
ncbi:MAG: TetR/AcrR family transcriptional regulator [Anaerolineae bacterium]|nr:TetR/AcrR family transcriptional regulator [Anaerolineae bacterium]